MARCIHTVDPIDASDVPVSRQSYEFLCPAYKLSYTTKEGKRLCMVVIARTSFAVYRMAERIFGRQGSYDFKVGRYLGARHPEPARARRRNA